MKAIWNGQVIAESNDTKIVEGNHYFPASSIRQECFEPSDQKSYCPWKGEASYYDLEVKGDHNAGAAWYYPSTKPAAKNIEGYVAFWKGVEVAP